MPKSLIAWIVFAGLLLLGFTNPIARQVLIIILPLGVKPDDILFWIALIGFLFFLFWQNFLVPSGRSKKKLRSDRERMKFIQRHVPELLAYVNSWIGEDPEKSLLYLNFETPRALENARNAYKIWLEAEHSFDSLRKSTHVGDLPELELIYSSLVGTGRNSLTWHELKERLEDTQSKGETNEPLAVRELSRTSRRRRGDWEVRGATAPTMNPDFRGSLDYIFDPANAEGA